MSDLRRHISIVNGDVLNPVHIYVEGATRYVSPQYNGKGIWHKKIQEAITAGSNGDIILVYPGTYAEDLILKSNQTLYFMPGATVVPPADGGAVPRNDHHIDVNGVNGYIRGYGEFLFTSTSTPTQYQISVRNSGTLYLECDRVTYSGGGRPVHVGVHADSGNILDLYIRKYLDKLQLIDTDFSNVTVNGWAYKIGNLEASGLDVLGILKCEYLDFFSWDYAGASPQTYRFQLSVGSFYTSTLTNTLSGKAKLSLKVGEWHHTPSVANEVRFTISDDAELLFEGKGISRSPGNVGPFFNMTHAGATLILKDTVLYTDYINCITADVFVDAYFYNSYSNASLHGNVGEYGGLSLNANAFVYI